MPLTVRTSSEFKELIRERNHLAVESTDVITCATMTAMDSTSVEFSIRIPSTIPSGFVDSVKLNGLSFVPDMIRDGRLDCMCFLDTSRDDGYGTGHLYRDIVSGKEIEIELTADDAVYCARVTIDDMDRAEMTVLYDTLASIRAYVNVDDERKPCFYSGPKGLGGNLSECALLGCGEIEPMFNHRGSSILHIGDSVLLNGSMGKVTRASDDDSDEVRYIQIVADMHGMDPRYMGGFATPHGTIGVVSIATAIAIDHSDMNRELAVSDMGVPLPISYRDSIISRHWGSYGDVWPNPTDIEIDRARCLRCEDCTANRYCPMGAHPSDGPDMDLCLSCGSCISNCQGNVFSGKLGHICIDGRLVPISIRLSSRKKAEELSDIAKDMIIKGEWHIRHDQ